MRKNLRGQIRMSETIAILFIFFILIMFGIVFYYRYSQVAFKEKQEERLEAKAMEITLKALFLPELGCSRGEAEAEDNCLDLRKLKAAEGVFSRYWTEYYFGLFPYANITVERVYPEPREKLFRYEKPKPDWQRKEATYFVVALKDEIEEAGAEGEGYSLGVLTVEAYS